MSKPWDKLRVPPEPVTPAIQPGEFCLPGGAVVVYISKTVSGGDISLQIDDKKVCLTPKSWRCFAEFLNTLLDESGTA
jgi:hypothetical protein